MGAKRTAAAELHALRDRAVLVGDFDTIRKIGQLWAKMAVTKEKKK